MNRIMLHTISGILIGSLFGLATLALATFIGNGSTVQSTAMFTIMFFPILIGASMGCLSGLESLQAEARTKAAAEQANGVQIPAL